MRLTDQQGLRTARYTKVKQKCLRLQSWLQLIFFGLHPLKKLTLLHFVYFFFITKTPLPNQTKANRHSSSLFVEHGFGKLSLQQVRNLSRFQVLSLIHISNYCVLFFSYVYTSRHRNEETRAYEHQPRHSMYLIPLSYYTYKSMCHQMKLCKNKMLFNLRKQLQIISVIQLLREKQSEMAYLHK